MNFLDIQNEIITLRIDQSKRTQIKNWVQTAYARIWASGNWSFKHVNNATLAVTSGSATPTMPTDFSTAESLFDNYGSEILYLEPYQWRQMFSDPTAGPGAPGFFTTVAGQIYLGPTPNITANFQLSYERRVAHLNNSLVVTAGNLSADTDIPIWSTGSYVEYDYILVLGGMALGQLMMNDFSASGVQAAHDEMLKAMQGDLENDAAGVFEKWGGFYQSALPA